MPLTRQKATEDVAPTAESLISKLMGVDGIALILITHDGEGISVVGNIVPEGICDLLRKALEIAEDQEPDHTYYSPSQDN